VSIVERVGNAGGLAKVVSSPHHGATITVVWPAPKSAGRPGAGSEAELLPGNPGSAS
jgi:hypothetical protein